MTCLILRYGFRLSTSLHTSVCFISGTVNVTFPPIQRLLKDEMNICDCNGRNRQQYLKTGIRYFINPVALCSFQLED